MRERPSRGCAMRSRLTSFSHLIRPRNENRVASANRRTASGSHAAGQRSLPAATSTVHDENRNKAPATSHQMGNATVRAASQRANTRPRGSYRFGLSSRH